MLAALEGLPAATVATGRDGRTVFVNALTAELFGHAREELVGRPVSMLWPERCASATRATWSCTSGTPAVLDRGVGLRGDDVLEPDGDADPSSCGSSWATAPSW